MLTLCFEINLRKVKWVLLCSNNLNFCNLPVHLNSIDKVKEFYSITNHKIFMGGDFNAQVSDINLEAFWGIWNLKSLGKDPTCFKTQTILLV